MGAQLVSGTQFSVCGRQTAGAEEDRVQHRRPKVRPDLDHRAALAQDASGGARSLAKRPQPAIPRRHFRPLWVSERLELGVGRGELQICEFAAGKAQLELELGISCCLRRAHDRAWSKSRLMCACGAARARLAPSLRSRAAHFRLWTVDSWAARLGLLRAGPSEQVRSSVHWCVRFSVHSCGATPEWPAGGTS